MATQEKLVKSLEYLRSLLNSNIPDTSTRKKDKILHCNVITDAMSNATIRIAPNFPYLLSFAIEVFLQLCDDAESDVRMVVDECLNRLIRATSNGNMSKIQIELHKEIKKNGASRSLRAALWRFAELACYIRPHKGKPYVVNLLPCIVKLTERKEEIVHESLSSSLPKIMAALGCFTTDTDVKALLKAFLFNISNSSAAIRRSNINCILSTCLNCRKPYVFITYVLNSLLDLLIPLHESNSSSLILGVMGCLKVVLLYINNCDNEHEIKDSFGVRKEVNETPLAIDRLLQVYELCLHYILDSDHNIINASLETLNVLLQNAPHDLKSALLCKNGINKNRLQFYETGKLKQRSPSQLSVATTTLSGEESLECDLMDSIRPDIEKWIDESKLSVMNVTYAKTSEFNKPAAVEIVASGPNNPNLEYSNIAIGSITAGDFVESSRSDINVSNGLDKLVLSESSSEHSFTQTCDRSLITAGTDIVYQEIDVGDFRDKDVPLLYCARLITKLFLLSGNPSVTIPDKTVRVSVKSLSLSCLATTFHLCPEILLKYLDKSSTRESSVKQQLSDILLFKDHSDPQLRGVVRTLIANFVKAVLINSNGNYKDWITANSYVACNNTLSIEYLVSVITAGLEDESSNCCKQTLQALSICLKLLLESQHSRDVIPILNALPLVAKNPYWLVKATLVEIVSDLNYITLNFVTGNLKFQDKVVFNILFELLKDDNQKVRSACSAAFVQIIPHLHFQQHVSNQVLVTEKSKYYKKLFMVNLFKNSLEMNSNKRHFIQNMLSPFNSLCDEFDEAVSQSLSRIIIKLTSYLLASTSKHFIHGCIETLQTLADFYPPTVYCEAWTCFEAITFRKNSDKNILSSSMGLFSICVGFLCNGSIAYDLNSHLNLLKLGSNIFAGLAVKNLKVKSDVSLEDNTQLWNMFADGLFSNLIEQFFNHLLKLLNIFCHVLDETAPSQPQNRPVLSNLPSAATLSPIKRRKSDLGERARSSIGKTEKDEKGDKKNENSKTNLMGYFATSPHYLKIYELLKTAYSNYRTTLELEASEKFLNLLRTTLQTLSKILELATLFESGRISEEILNYFRCTFAFEPSSTVECVQQLLRSLFGTNLTCMGSLIFIKQPTEEKENDLFYSSVFQSTYNDMTRCINSFCNLKVERDGDNVVMGYLHRRESKSTVLPRGADKILANYIRLFEPMVIKSLKQYTITSDVTLQCKVLQLLCQLVQLRVNYCLLDSEQIFIGFVLKQFEYIEEGQIPLSSELIPWIFNFLVQLSYSKQHSKSIIGIPKIIQLCDGLMASGQPPLTHCVPALKPVVEDIFLFRNKTNTPDFKELETTREVLLSMLLRLLEYADIISLITLILNESKYCQDNSDKWYKWSKQVCDVFFPMLKHNKVVISCKEDLIAIRSLIFALNPSTFKPLNNILLILFDEPPHLENSLTQVNRWFGKVLVLLLIVSKVKEELLLVKISEVKDGFAPRSIFKNVRVMPDPLNVTNTSKYLDDVKPEIVFVRFVFRVIDIVVERSMQLAGGQENLFLIEQLSSLLMFCLHVFQSGSHCKISNTAIELIANKCKNDGHEKVPVENINGNLIKLAMFFPTVVFEWCYLLTLLNCEDKDFWFDVLQMEYAQEERNNGCINLEIVRVGSAIVFCDYLSENTANSELLSWFVTNNIELIIRLTDEEPVNEFLSSLHRNSTSSELVITCICTKCLSFKEPILRRKILQSVENVHSSQVGNLLSLLLPKLLDFRHLTLSRLAANLASRKIELLLTMSKEEVKSQLSKEDLIQLMSCLIETKHETLVSLVNKLATQYYDINLLEIDQKRQVAPSHIKTLQVDKSWYVSQIKSKDCDSVKSEIAELLANLEYPELLEILSQENFQKSIIKECIVLGKKKFKENCTQKPDILKASFQIVFQNLHLIIGLLPAKHEVYEVADRDESLEEQAYSAQLTRALSNNSTWTGISKMMSSVMVCAESSSCVDETHTFDNCKDLIRFSVLCLESINFLVDENNLNVNFVDGALSCAKAIAQNRRFNQVLSSNLSWLCSSVNSIYKLVSYLLLGHEPLPSISKYGLNSSAAGHACYQLATLISWSEKIQNSLTIIPQFLLSSINFLIISYARLPLVNSYLLTPPSAWKSGLDVKLSGPLNTQVPSLPIEFLQEVDILEEFIFRITLLGWTSRQQFEETWMCLLSVLSSNATEESSMEEINSISHVTGLAVQAITALLVKTLYLPIIGDPNSSQLLHVSRDPFIGTPNLSSKKLKWIHDKLQYKFQGFSKWVSSGGFLLDSFNKSNLDKISEDYSFDQLSVEYLLISANLVETVDEKSLAAQSYAKWQQTLEESGLDLNSCLQFLIDLYNQWIKSQTTPLRILYEVIKSVVIISDLFTEKSQFSWMLDVFLDLSRSHTVEDEISQQYLVIGASKAVAVLTPDLETYESIKKLILQNLKSGFLPSKIAGLRGILYLLQGCVLSNTHIGGLSEELQIILSITLDYIQSHINFTNGVLNQSIEHSLVFWAITFYLIENVEESNLGVNFVADVVQGAIACVLQQRVASITNRVLKGLERLVIRRSLNTKQCDQLYKLSLELMRRGHPATSFPSLQMLLTCMYTNSANHLDSNLTVEQNPDDLVQTIEKISFIFDHIRKGFPLEVEILCSVLPDILNDFFAPSDILTKVLGEFLSPQQPHPKLLCRVVFEVFQSAIEQSQLSLLQDWVVFSLTNFTQSSMGMSIWCLTCFFISASTNRWLTSMFPYVQSRIGRYEYEERVMLCITGVDFYNNLTNDKQRQIFVDSFKNVKHDVTDSPFQDLLASL